jgi:O-antigen/teichoic acid export membrane protein
VANTTRPAGISRNVGANWLTFLLVAGVSFFLSPFVVNRLGNTAYGVWTLLTALVGYLGLIDFGVRGAVTRYVAHHHAAGDNEACSSIVSAGIVLFGLLGTVAILSSGLLAFVFPIFFNIPESLVTDTRVVLFAGGLTVAVTLLSGVFGGVIVGLERFDIAAGVEILITTIRTVAIVLALLEGYGLIMLAFIQLASSVLMGVASWAVVQKLYPELRLRFRTPHLPHMRTIVSFSMFSSLINIFGALIYYSDVVVIGVFLPISMAAFYAIAGNLFNYSMQVGGALSQVMTPRVSALASMGSERVVEEIVSVARIATLAMAPIAVTFWFRGESFINLWMGTDYGPASGEVLRTLAFVVLLIGARSVAVASIMGVNKHRGFVGVYAFEAVCNLALSVALVKPFGLVGVALGTVIPSVVVSLAYIPRCLSTSTGVPVRRFYCNAWILPIIACVPYALVNVLLEYFVPARNLAIFFMQVILTLPLVAVSAMALCLTRLEKEQVNSATRRIAAIVKRGIARKEPWFLRR